MTDYQLLSSAYFAGTISREDELRLLAWLREDAQHIAIWREWEQAWVEGNSHSATTDAAWLRLQDKAHGNRKQRPVLTSQPLWRRPVVRWAAVACCAMLLIVFSLHTSLRPTSSTEPTIVATATPTSVQSGDAVATIILPDSSRVFINMGSILTYNPDFGQVDRQVTLIGEAYFEVAHDATRPFIVRADGLKIRVTGTKFNVAAYEDNTQTTVTLLEGGVKVTNPLFEADLLPNEKLVYTRENKELSKRQCDAAASIAWIDGMLDFDRVRLEELLARLSRLYNEPISIDSEVIRQMDAHYYMDERYPLNEVMDALGEVYHLVVTHDDNGYHVSI